VRVGAESKKQVLARLRQAVAQLEACREFSLLVPEVRVNFVYALAQAQTAADVAGVDGRITVVHGMPKAAGPVRLGASDHMARLVIELRRHSPNIRAGINFRWSEGLLKLVQEWCAERNWAIGMIDRSHEPRNLVGKDRSSIPWKVAQLVATTGGKVPPVFYETRGWGKEPLFVLVGCDPVPLAAAVRDIARRWHGQKN